jgi:hypothetical protein
LGILPEELIGKSYRDFIVVEDLPKTTAMTSSILSGEDIEVLKIVTEKKRWYYNLWSARWDAKAKLMFCVARDAGKHFNKK